MHRDLVVLVVQEKMITSDEMRLTESTNFTAIMTENNKYIKNLI